MGIHARLLVVALVLCSSVVVAVTPAHADADTTENHLCLNTGFGYFGVSDHVHVTDTGGAYHISTFAQASAWTYAGAGTYCFQNSATTPCAMTVSIDVLQDGLFITSTPTYSNSGVHSVSTGNHSYGFSAGVYTVIGYVKAYFGNSCSSEADGATYVTEYN